MEIGVVSSYKFLLDVGIESKARDAEAWRLRHPWQLSSQHCYTHDLKIVWAARR